MKEMAIDSTELRQLVSEEIDLISDDKLVGFYQFIHYFRIGTQTASNGVMVSNNGYHSSLLNHQKESEKIADESDSTAGERILSFAGAWSDMPDEEFDDFLNDIYARRRGEHLKTEESAPNSSAMAEMFERLKDDKADWLIFCEAALRAGNFRSLDQVILQALDAWFAQLPSELRWDIAIDLYTNEQISSGKAAEIAGLNYFVFLEELRAHGIKFIGGEMAEGEVRERQEALLDELTVSSSEAILASSRSWSDIPDEEFNQLLRDVYEQRRIQNIETEKLKPKSKSNGPTMAEMLKRLWVINEEEPIDLEMPPRVNRPVDFSFLEEEEDDVMVTLDNPDNLTASGETYAISL